MNLLRFENLGAGRWAMRTPYHPQFPELAHTVPGLKWDRQAGAWIGYADGVNLLTVKLEEAKVVKVRGARPPSRAPLSDKAFSRDPIGFDGDYGLRNYQKEGVNFLINTMSSGAVLADSMALGKTRSVLAAINELHQFPAVIVCPANVKSSWKSEASKLGLDAHVLFGMSPPRTASSTHLTVSSFSTTNSSLLGCRT